MLNESDLRKKVLLRLLGSPATVVPFMLGMTALTASWALEWQPGIGLFAGIAGALVAAGTFFTRLLVRGDKVAERVLRETEQARRKTREQALNDQDRQLTVADQDPRPETALRDLRALVKAFADHSDREIGCHAGQAIEIQSRIGLLFDQCVDTLRQTDQLWQVARQLHTPAVRQPILAQREQLIGDVQASIRQLSDTLVALQRLGAGDQANAQLARLRDELDQSLAVAKAVEARVNNFVKEASTMATPPVIETKPRT